MPNLNKKLIDQYNKLYPKWLKAHQKYWKKYAPMPYVTGKVKSDLTVGQQSQMVTGKSGRPFGAVDRPRKPDPNMFGSNKNLRAAIKSMKQELSPAYQKRRRQTQRESIIKTVQVFGNPTLEQSVRELTVEQVEYLMDATIFADVYWVYAYPPSGVQQEDVVDEQLLFDLVNAAKTNVKLKPGQRLKQKIAQRRRKKKAESLQQRWTREEAEREARNIELAKQGPEALKRYGVAAKFGEGKDWWKRYFE